MKLASKLPDDHGLAVIQPALIAEPDRAHLVVGWVDCSRLTTEIDTGEVTPTMRFLQVEAVDDEAVEAAMARARARRTGQQTLPVDTETGEILDDGGDQ